jgi:hypothetical protein
MMHTHGKGQTHMALGRYEQSAMISIWVYQSHESVLQLCGKHYLQGVWGAARPPSREREGRSPLADATAHLPREQQEVWRWCIR